MLTAQYTTSTSHDMKRHLILQVLRCHTSAHQAELLRKGEKSFLLTGDVYRRDSIDASHYPVFHQMEGLYVLTDEEIEASGKSGTELAAQELKFVLSGLTKHLFGDVEMKFVDAYFPFTVSHFGLGCVVLHMEVLDAVYSVKQASLTAHCAHTLKQHQAVSLCSCSRQLQVSGPQCETSRSNVKMHTMPTHKISSKQGLGPMDSLSSFMFKWDCSHSRTLFDSGQTYWLCTFQLLAPVYNINFYRL